MDCRCGRDLPAIGGRAAPPSRAGMTYLRVVLDRWPCTAATPPSMSDGRENCKKPLFALAFPRVIVSNDKEPLIIISMATRLKNHKTNAQTASLPCAV